MAGRTSSSVVTQVEQAGHKSGHEGVAGPDRVDDVGRRCGGGRGVLRYRRAVGDSVSAQGDDGQASPERAPVRHDRGGGVPGVEVVQVIAARLDHVGQGDDGLDVGPDLVG